MPYADPAVAREYYRHFKKSDKKRRSDKYYTAARHANERARKHGCPGTITTADARSVLQGACCHYCGTTEGWIGLDHVVPLARGGPNTPANLVAACHSCNGRKHTGLHVNQWSSKHEACIECGLTNRKHASRGRCTRCHQRFQKRTGNNRSSTSPASSAGDTYMSVAPLVEDNAGPPRPTSRAFPTFSSGTSAKSA